MKIFKWALETKDSQVIEMPAGAVILSLQMQHGMPHIWALVDESKDNEKRAFVTYGAGNRMPENPGAYIGTYQLDFGAFVFHVFEKITTQQKHNNV